MSGLLTAVFSYSAWLNFLHAWYCLWLTLAIFVFILKIQARWFWIGTKWSRTHHRTAIVFAPASSVSQHPEPFFLLASDLLPKLDLLLWRRLSLIASILVLQTFCSFPQSKETDAWLLFPFFLSSLLFLPLPGPDNLAVLFPCFSTALLQPCLLRQGNEEAHQAALGMHSFQLIVCSWIVLLRKLFLRWTVCPFTAGFKNTFGCFKH